MLIVAMMLDVSIAVPELDDTFAKSIKEVEAVYHEMYPRSGLRFRVSALQIRNCSYKPSGGTSMFFTGGLDATSALTQKAEEKPLLINIWGGDISTNDNESHISLENYFKRLTSDIGNDYMFVKSNCREMYDEEKVTRYWGGKISPFKNHGWWANIGHILSMASLIAPIAYIERIGIHYVGSSYDSKSSVFDANNDALLNALKFSNLRFVSVDSDINRMQKAKNVIDFCNKTHIPVELKVCWYRKAGQNCSRCEKCYRTIMNIIANHGNPNDYGFKVDANTMHEMQTYLENTYVNQEFWTEIQRAFVENKSDWENTEVAWILNFKFNSMRAVRNKAVQVVKRLTK